MDPTGFWSGTHIRKKRLTWRFGDDVGSALEVARAGSTCLLLVVAVEGEGSMRGQCVRTETVFSRLDLLAVRAAFSACVVQRCLELLRPHCSVRHAPCRRRWWFRRRWLRRSGWWWETVGLGVSVDYRCWEGSTCGFLTWAVATSSSVGYVEVEVVDLLFRWVEKSVVSLRRRTWWENDDNNNNNNRKPLSFSWFKIQIYQKVIWTIEIMKVTQYRLYKIEILDNYSVLVEYIIFDRMMMKIEKSSFFFWI